MERDRRPVSGGDGDIGWFGRVGVVDDSGMSELEETGADVAPDEEVERIARDLVERYADALERLGR